MTDKKRVLDLFSGCGGMSTGFESTGLFKVVAANEYWEPACKTWESNHTGKMIKGDITDKSIRDQLVELCEGSVDVVIGGVPCVAFSMSGKRDPNDPRGKLFEQYVEMVEHLQPKVFVMENVVGIKSMIHSEGPVPQIIISRFSEKGYDVAFRTLLASDYGVPQDRERVIFVGVKRGSRLPLEPSWPTPTHGQGLIPKRTVRMAVDDLEEVPDDKEFSHIRTKHSKSFLEKISNTPIGSSVTGFGEAFFRVWPDKPSPTVKANNGSVFIHYRSDRCMTPRELARLQDFPDNFKFNGSKYDVLVQIGNAVPIGLAREIGYEVNRMLTANTIPKKVD